MTDTEREGEEPTALDLLVDRAAKLFWTYDVHPRAIQSREENPLPYLIQHAAEDVVDEVIQAGKSPAELVLELRKLRPDFPTSQEVYEFAAKGNWDQAFRQLAETIIDRELRIRDDNIRRMNKRRLRDYVFG